MEKQKFERFRGSTVRLPLQLLDKDENPVDISADDLVFSLKLSTVVTVTAHKDDAAVPAYDPDSIIIERDNDTATVVAVIGHELSNVDAGTYPFDLWRYNTEDETRKVVILADLIIHETVTHEVDGDD
jgi:hypothetical protein